MKDLKKGVFSYVSIWLCKQGSVSEFVPVLCVRMHASSCVTMTECMCKLGVESG